MNAANSESPPGSVNAPSSWRRRFKYLALAVTVVALADHYWFDFTRDRLIRVGQELGGSAYSIGGWPFGQEHVLRFDEPLSDDALRQLFDAVPGSRRSLCVYFNCDVSEERAAEIRRLAPERCSIIVDEQER